eukprot:scaffold118748_cov44-Prasinocladus_malaysianus.AAC.1
MSGSSRPVLPAGVGPHVPWIAHGHVDGVAFGRQSAGGLERPPRLEEMGHRLRELRELSGRRVGVRAS